MFLNLSDALDWVNNSIRFSKKTNLDKIKNALRLLGNPEKSFKSIHIGGTNGKGSSCSYVYNMLKLLGLKVGLYTSPFVINFNERIKINDNYISDSDCLDLINRLYDFNEEFKKDNEPLSFFEIVTLMCFMYFKENNVDIAVIEVGLGGRLDATNVITPIVSGITNIQKDHMKQLGKFYSLIAKEKLGIMKEGVPFVTTEKRETLMPIFKEYAIDNHTTINFVRNVRNISLDRFGTTFTYKGDRYHTHLIGVHQAYNAAFSIEIAKILKEKYGYNITKEIIDKALDITTWPGRFEPFMDGRVILDGGHNPAGVTSVKKTLELYTTKNVVTVFCAMKDKDTYHMVKLLDSFSKKVIFTEIDYHRSEKAANLIKLSHLSDKLCIVDFKEAINTALKDLKDDEILLINGSLYFISEARKIFIGVNDA